MIGTYHFSKAFIASSRLGDVLLEVAALAVAHPRRIVLKLTAVGPMGATYLHQRLRLQISPIRVGRP